MKNFVKGLIVVTAALIVVPLVTYAFSHESRKNPDIPDDVAALPVVSENIENQPYSFIQTIRVYDEVTMTQTEYSCEDFLVYSTMGAISPTAEAELLKAQAVLMYTYILGRRLDEAKTPTPELNGCDISTDSNKYVKLITTDEINLMFKDKSEEYTQIVRNAVKSVIGEYVSYKSRPIVPAYCYSCGGVTESSLTVLGKDVEYLRSVKSAYDGDFKLEAVMTKDELFARISTQSDSKTLLGDPQNWIELSNVSQTGYVLEATLDGETKVSGQQLAQWLNLPSARFTISYSPEFERFSFSVSGSGHLVGMSQYGANEMAKNGFTYRKILTYFFSGVDIEKSIK